MWSFSTPRQRLWGAVGGVIIAGSIFKVAYFKFCRDILVEHSTKTHLDATAHLKEAKEFAAWSNREREKKRAELPPITLEQKQQIREYLRIMQEHHALNPDSEAPDRRM